MTSIFIGRLQFSPIKDISTVVQFFGHIILKDITRTRQTFIVKENWRNGTYCQWLISAHYDDGYVTLEFEKLNVRNTIAF